MLKKIELLKYNEVIYFDKLDNGLEVYLWPNNKVSNYYATFSAKYGSVDTKFKVGSKTIEVPKGLAHFLEHIKFNEGPNKTAHDFYNKLGTSINAFTTFDFTSYEVFGSDKIEENITHLLDYVQSPYFTKELIEKEKKIILNEVKMGKNNPYKVLYYALNNALYTHDQRKYFVTGDEEDVKSITIDDVHAAYDNFYHPSNMFLVVTGNFNPEYLATVIRENQNNKTFAKYTNPIKIKTNEGLKVAESEKEIYGNVSAPKVKIAYKIKKSELAFLNDVEKLIYPRIILNANFGSTSEVREYLLENNLVTKLGCNASLCEDYLIIVLSAETKCPKEIVKILDETFKKMTLNKERLERRIRCNIASVIYGFDDIEYMNAHIQDNIMTYNKIIDNEYDIYKSLNVTTAKKVIDKMVTDNKTVVTMLPKEEK